MRQPKGGLKNLRGTDWPQDGLVQLTYASLFAGSPPPPEATPPLTSEREAARSARRKVTEAGQQTSPAKCAAEHRKDREGEEGKAQLEVIKSVERMEQILNFTDTASDGTNRMSATQIKPKHSKMSGGAINTNPSQHLKESQVTFEQEPRRSVEI